ncbi:hypothetical protein MPSEU_000285800 [Mayamaea pseudoterrestris]|nr:hypothetical protein MPSEU_000285800 [Mayamaea pseudoterrestris]
MLRNHLFTPLLIISNYIHVAVSFQSRISQVFQRYERHHFRSDDSALRFAQQQQDANSSNDFWSQQKSLMEDLKQSAETSLAVEEQDKYNQQLQALIVYSAYTTFAIFCGLWTAFENPFVAFSYLFGASLGLAYAYGLGKYVEQIGGVATEAEAIRGAGVGQARFAFLILLFIFVGKFRSSGLMEVPTILGFFTYQLGSLLQGLRATDNK